MYSDIFCKVYNEFGWNYYPEVFAEQLLLWLSQNSISVSSCMDLGCGTGILCGILNQNGIRAAGMDLSPGMIEIAKKNYPDCSFSVADMITFRPDAEYDLVTCTGDALNHIPSLRDIEMIFQNVYQYTAPGGYFIFDIMNEKEISTSEPFEMDFTDTTKVWFQMTQPDAKSVNLRVRVSEKNVPQFEENIHEYIHDPEIICKLLRKTGFSLIKCADQLPDHGTAHGTTWFIIAKKEA